MRSRAYTGLLDHATLLTKAAFSAASAGVHLHITRLHGQGLVYVQVAA